MPESPEKKRVRRPSSESKTDSDSSEKEGRGLSPDKLRRSARRLSRSGSSALNLIAAGFDFAAASTDAVMRMASNGRGRLNCWGNVGAKSLSCATGAKFDNWESYKFDGEESGVHLERRTAQTRKYKFRLLITSHMLVIIIAVALACIAAVLAYGASQLHRAINQRVLDTMWAREDGEGRPDVGSMWSAYAVYVALNLTLVFAAALCVYKAPSAAGSGLALLKANLNGVAVGSRWAGWMTLSAKVVGTLFIVATGLPLGKEGPMVHIGAMVARQVSNSRTKLTDKLLELRMPKHQREWVGMGAAAGVAAAFNAPLGGILYSFEEVCSHWTSALTWRSFQCVVVVSAIAALLIDNSNGFLEDSDFVLGVAGEVDIVHPPMSRTDIVWLAILGAAGGGVGGTFTQTVTAFNLRRQRFFGRRTSEESRARERVLEAVVLAFVAFTLYFWLPVGFDCTACPDADDVGGGSSEYKDCQLGHHLHLHRFNCPEGQFSQVGTLLHSGQEGVVKHLFARHDASPFSVGALFGFALVYYLIAMVLMGLAVPAGNFVPAIIIGAAMGRGWALLLQMGDLMGSHHVEGVYAICGAAAVLGGMTHMTITVAAILVEITDDIEILPSIMFVLMISKFVSVEIGPNFDHCMMELLHLPFLEEDPPLALDMLSARNIMASPVTYLSEVMRVGDIAQILTTTSHNGFPVVTSFKVPHVCGYILRRQLLVLLECRVWHVVDFRLADSRMKAKFVASFANVKEDISVVLTREDTDALVDLRPYIDPCPFIIGELMPLNRAHRMFNELGVRHLPVVSREMTLCGIITRKDLMPGNISERLKKSSSRGAGGRRGSVMATANKGPADDRTVPSPQDGQSFVDGSPLPGGSPDLLSPLFCRHGGGSPLGGARQLGVATATALLGGALHQESPVPQPGRARSIANYPANMGACCVDYSPPMRRRRHSAPCLALSDNATRPGVMPDDGSPSGRESPLLAPAPRMRRPSYPQMPKLNERRPSLPGLPPTSDILAHAVAAETWRQRMSGEPERERRPSVGSDSTIGSAELRLADIAQAHDGYMLNEKRLSQDLPPGFMASRGNSRRSSEVGDPAGANVHGLAAWHPGRNTKSEDSNVSSFQSKKSGRSGIARGKVQIYPEPNPQGSPASSNHGSITVGMKASTASSSPPSSQASGTPKNQPRGLRRVASGSSVSRSPPVRSHGSSKGERSPKPQASESGSDNSDTYQRRSPGWRRAAPRGASSRGGASSRIEPDMGGDISPSGSRTASTPAMRVAAVRETVGNLAAAVGSMVAGVINPSNPEWSDGPER